MPWTKHFTLPVTASNVRPGKTYQLLLILFIVCALLAVSMPTHASQIHEIPSKAYQYRKYLHAEVNRVWGPLSGQASSLQVVPVSASTIQQESAWNPLAQSQYAKGLTQFTDATWADMERSDPSLRQLGDVWSPYAAIRAMVSYHKRLWTSLASSTTTSDRWAFTTAAYNGGIGWIFKDQAMTKSKGLDPSLWWKNTALYSPRASWAFKENRDYPEAILHKWLPIYTNF